jgi:hypothetical protein
MLLHSDEGADEDVGPSGVTAPHALLSNPARGTSVYLLSIAAISCFHRYEPAVSAHWLQI